MAGKVAGTMREIENRIGSESTAVLAIMESHEFAKRLQERVINEFRTRKTLDMIAVETAKLTCV